MQKLDDHLNGENSLLAQKHRFNQVRKEYRDKKLAELRELKKQYKQTLADNSK